MGCERIEIPAEPFLLDGYVQCRPPSRAFKDAVLDEMRDPMQFLRLLSCTDAEEKPECR